MIRPIIENDYGEWQQLWDAYLDFYRRELTEATTLATFARLCQRADGLFGFVAEAGTSLVGFAHALVHPSTWSEAGYCYLEDLFVAPPARGTGVARELLEAVIAEGHHRQVGRIYWHTQEFNAPARSLYDQVAHRSSFVVYLCP
ncbi:MAG: GNAT family N-acetyltransferase [Acidimicrobiales bacterium]|nr:GNAT family N-acetyltransferase [Acidimicrobiales bacterium]MBO0886716.1 GNAT family N-acetyltransferase [Acidimicrobiales bacterium]